jgi:hypothetical protein
MTLSHRQLTNLRNNINLFSWLLIMINLIVGISTVIILVLTVGQFAYLKQFAVIMGSISIVIGVCAVLDVILYRKTR